MSGGDDSNAHVWYYLVFPEVWDNLSALRKLVGFGIGNSGYMYTLLWNRFSEKSSWIVESDYISILLNYGILGFFLYYIWLFSILYHGMKINPQYGFLMGILIILGFFYNVQYNGVLLFEMILCICIHKKVDFFAHNIEKHTLVFGKMLPRQKLAIIFQILINKRLIKQLCSSKE